MPIRSDDFNMLFIPADSLARPHRIYDPFSSFPAPLLFRQSRAPSRDAARRSGA